MTFIEAHIEVMKLPDVMVETSDGVFGSTHHTAALALNRFNDLRNKGEKPEYDTKCGFYKRAMVEMIPKIQKGEYSPRKDFTVPTNINVNI